MPKPDDVTSAPGEVTRLPSPTPSSAGWLSSSDAISHGRFAPGTVLAERYRIVELLGKGGMGEVYRADDLKLGQQIALKFLPQDLAKDPVRLAQFHGEVRLTRQISHPNVCRVYDVDEVDGHPFLSMEYIDGEDLASLLRQVGRFPEDKALQIAHQFCAGVAAAHDRGVLHRDLKPANVMIDGRGDVRILDFGLAAAADAAVDIRAGTPGYMAPEQLAGREVSIKSDIYAIGLVLFEIFTGKRTFDARSLADLLRLHDNYSVTPPTSIVPSLDPAIERAILRCLAREPEQRPASARAVAAALPGGDPLAAAIAAGETPSPAMVAAAGHEHALPLRIALGSVAAVGVILAVLPFIADRVLLLRAIPTPKAIDVLVDRAQTIRASLGYTDVPRDEFYDIDVDHDYLRHIATSDSSPGRWTRLATGRPAAVLFWYRSSPRNLAVLGLELTPSRSDPPQVLSGMTSITTDTQGRLVEFNAVVPQREPDAGPASVPDWTRLFEAAELPITSFSQASPSWTPRTFADTRAAWEGPLPEDPATRVRIEAAAYRGRPVFFQIVGPWSRAGRMEFVAERSIDTAISILGTLVLMATMVGAGLVARRHLRRGRGDRSGATRLAFFIVCVVLTGWGFGAHHVSDISVETDAFLRICAIGLFNGFFVWLFYLALEPLVRKWHPHALVGWSRVLAGAIHDPQVGRDVLAGVVAAALWALIRLPRGLMPILVGAPPSAPLDTLFAPLLGMRQTITMLVSVVPNGVATGLVVILVFTVLRMLFRRTWVTVAVMSVIVFGVIAVGLTSAPGRWTELLLAAVGLALIFTVVVRFGLLATIVMFTVSSVFELLPLTADPRARYFAASTWLLAATLALAVWAAYAARAGQPLLKLADD